MQVEAIDFINISALHDDIKNAHIHTVKFLEEENKSLQDKIINLEEHNQFLKNKLDSLYINRATQAQLLHQYTHQQRKLEQDKNKVEKKFREEIAKLNNLLQQYREMNHEQNIPSFLFDDDAGHD